VVALAENPLLRRGVAVDGTHEHSVSNDDDTLHRAPR